MNQFLPCPWLDFRFFHSLNGVDDTGDTWRTKLWKSFLLFVRDQRQDFSCLVIPLRWHFPSESSLSVFNALWTQLNRSRLSFYRRNEFTSRNPFTGFLSFPHFNPFLALKLVGKKALLSQGSLHRFPLEITQDMAQSFGPHIFRSGLCMRLIFNCCVHELHVHKPITTLSPLWWWRSRRWWATSTRTPWRRPAALSRPGYFNRIVHKADYFHIFFLGGPQRSFANRKSANLRTYQIC